MNFKSWEHCSLTMKPSVAEWRKSRAKSKSTSGCVFTVKNYHESLNLSTKFSLSEIIFGTHVAHQHWAFICRVHWCSCFHNRELSRLHITPCFCLDQEHPSWQMKGLELGWKWRSKLGEVETPCYYCCSCNMDSGSIPGKGDGTCDLWLRETPVSTDSHH